MGFMNTLGHFGGSVAPAVTGFLLTFSNNSWNTVFYCSAVIYAAGAICWRFIPSTRPLDLEPQVLQFPANYSDTE